MTWRQFRNLMTFCGIVALLAVLLSGCAIFGKPADTVQFQRGGFFLSYVQMARIQAVAEDRLTRACEAKQLSAEDCRDLAEANRFWHLTARMIEKSLANPETELDWEAVADALGLVLKVAGKAGGAAVGIPLP